MIALYLILENDSMFVKDILLSNIKYIEVNVGLIHQDGLLQGRELHRPSTPETTR